MTSNSLKQIDKTRYSLYNLNYRLILRTYNNKSLIDKASSYLLKQIFEKLCPYYHIHLNKWDAKKNYIDIKFHCSNRMLPEKFIDSFKTKASKAYHYVICSETNQQSKKLWNRGFCLLTTSSKVNQSIKDYLRNN